MNYLAHTVLSTTEIDYQIANLSADAVKGKPWAGCSQAHLNGLMMHRTIDGFTDRHALVLQAKSRLGGGYLRGVVIDILFDHFLTKHWTTFVRFDFEAFITDFYQSAAASKNNLPPTVAGFIDRVVSYDFLHSYQDFSQMGLVFERIDKRLSQKLRDRESTVDYLPTLNVYYDELENDFLQFFPALINVFLEQSQVSDSENYFYIHHKNHCEE